MECLKMIFVKHRNGVSKVPCGKCAFCLQNRRSSWMFRIYHEMRSQEYPGYFLTLTYDEKHVPRCVLKPDQGALVPRGTYHTLRFRDLQKFFKRLRKEKFYVKYIAVGEYGSQTNRPHYHAILWTDATVEAIERQWFHGAVHFGRITMASAMYTFKYIIQPKSTFDESVERPRAQFSRGIGVAYLGRNYESGIQVADYHNRLGSEKFYSYIGSQKVALPRYYVRKIFLSSQCYDNNRKVKERADVKLAEELARLVPPEGVSVSEYRQQLRVEAAARIISKTKFKQVV